MVLYASTGQDGVSQWDSKVQMEILQVMRKKDTLSMLGRIYLTLLLWKPLCLGNLQLWHHQGALKVTHVPLKQAPQGCCGE